MKRIIASMAATIGLIFTGLSFAVDMPPLAKELNCVSCHAIDHKVVGPAWIEVSKRYRDKRNDPAFLNQLVKKVSRGGQGNWGDVPMVANDPVGTRHDKIDELVKFVLALSNQLPENKGKM